MDIQANPKNKYAKYNVDVKQMQPYILPVSYLKNLLILMYFLIVPFIAGMAVAIYFMELIVIAVLAVFVLALGYGIWNYKKIIREKSGKIDMALEAIKFPTTSRADFTNNRSILVKENVNMREKVTNIVLYSYEVYNEAQQKIGYVKEKWIDINEITNNLALAKIAKYIPPEFMGTKEMLFYGIDNQVFMKVRKSLKIGREGFVEILTPNEEVIAQLFSGFAFPKQRIYITNPKDQEAGYIIKSFWGWNSKVFDMNKMIVAEVNKKFMGVLKETFTSADSYHVSIMNNSLDPHIAVAVPFIFDRLIKRSQDQKGPVGLNVFGNR